METIFPIFPAGPIETSLITPVLLGLLVQLAFSELFGWGLVGNVVPGYLAVVMTTFPESGFVVVIEAIITYALVMVLSEGGSLLGIWFRFFGRDRFFLFVFVSVVVRLIMDMVVLPHASVVFSRLTGFPLRDNVASIGLVLVPLLANSWFKTGLLKGVLQVGTVTGVTFLILNLLLVPFTNLDFIRFELTYEKVALDFAAAAKIYIILLSAGLLSSFFNIRYGWDFRGIMVPALLAVAAFTPLKILSTFVEALIAAGAFLLLTRLPVIRRLDLRGGRQVVVVFGLAYALRLIVAAVLPAGSAFRVSDWFGFGYLVSALLAVKIIEKRSGAQVLAAAGVTTAVGLALGSLLGFGLLSQRWLPQADSQLPEAEGVEVAEGSLVKDVLLSKSYLLSSPLAGQRGPTPEEVQYAATMAVDYLEGRHRPQSCERPGKRTRPAGAAGFLCHLRRDPVLGEYYLLHEKAAQLAQVRGLGIVVIRPGGRGPVLQVPYPIREAEATEIALGLMRATDARLLVIAGADDSSRQAAWADALLERNTVLEAIYERVADLDTLQVRVQTATPATSRWHVRYKLPASVGLRQLRQEFGELDLLWRPPAESNLQWRTVRNTFSVLLLARASGQRFVLAKTLPLLPQPPVVRAEIQGSIASWLMEAEAQAPAGGRSELAPAWQEIEMTRRQLVPALVEQAVREDCAERPEVLRGLATLASVCALQLAVVKTPGKPLLVLREDPLAPPRGFGQVVIRCGPTRPWVFVVPKPRAEVGTLALGAAWFDLLQARALVLGTEGFESSGAGEPLADPGLAHALVRELMRRAQAAKDWLVVAVRGSAARGMISPLLLGTGEEVAEEEDLSPPVRDLIDWLREAGEPIALVGTGGAQVRFLGGDSPLFSLINNLNPGHYAVIWASPDYRFPILDGRRQESQIELFDSLGISYRAEPVLRPEAMLRDPLPEVRARGPRVPGAAERMPQYLADFATLENLAALEALLRAPEIRLQAFLDQASLRGYLVGENKALRCVVMIRGGPVDLSRWNVEPAEVPFCMRKEGPGAP